HRFADLAFSNLRSNSPRPIVPRFTLQLQGNFNEKHFCRKPQLNHRRYVRSLFQAYGTVERVNLITDRDTGQARGFGFVKMSNNAEADRAIAELNGRELDGRALNVNEARPKEDRGFGGGGGGGNRRGGGGGGRNRY